MRRKEKRVNLMNAAKTVNTALSVFQMPVAVAAAVVAAAAIVGLHYIHPPVPLQWEEAQEKWETQGWPGQQMRVYEVRGVEKKAKGATGKAGQRPVLARELK